jgi:hypothetical protein
MPCLLQRISFYSKLNYEIEQHNIGNKGMLYAETGKTKSNEFNYSYFC